MSLCTHAGNSYCNYCENERGNCRAAPQPNKGEQLLTLDMQLSYARYCAAGNHRIGQDARDSGHGARPVGPQICLQCRVTLQELFTQARQQAVAEFAGEVKATLETGDIMTDESTNVLIDDLLAQHQEKLNLKEINK